MRNGLIIFFLLLFVFDFALTQDTKKSNSVRIEKTQDYFFELCKQGEPPKRGEFETIEAYKKRLPSTTFDTGKVYYIKIQETKENLDKLYSYDIENQVLTFAGGNIFYGGKLEYEPLPGTSICILTSIEDKGSYIATNAFGAKMTVEKYYIKKYIINFTNLTELPDSIYEPPNDVFKMSILKPPKEAEKLSKNIDLIIGIKPYGPTNSTMECTATNEPTFTDPKDWATFIYMIDAKFVSLMLRERSTNKIIKGFELLE